MIIQAYRESESINIYFIKEILQTVGQRQLTLDKHLCSILKKKVLVCQQSEGRHAHTAYTSQTSLWLDREKIQKGLERACLLTEL